MDKLCSIMCLEMLTVLELSYARVYMTYADFEGRVQSRYLLIGQRGLVDRLKDPLDGLLFICSEIYFKVLICV